MNKKGFTLVELLAVIVILGLVITIVGTKGFGAFDNTTKAITSQNINAIKESAKVYLTDVIYCDDDIDTDFVNETKLSLNLDESVKNCEDLKTYYNTSRTIPFSFLKDNKYISGSDIEDDSLYNNDKIEITGRINESKIEINVNLK